VGTHINDHQEVYIAWLMGLGYNPGFSFASEFATFLPEFQKFKKYQRSIYSSNLVPGGLDGSSAGPNGAIPKWHMHHIVAGAFESFDYNSASYKGYAEPPYQIPRNFFEFLLFRGLHMHVHGCELSENHAFGRIELRNKDPFVPPFVDPRWGSSDEDNAEMVHCIKTVREIMRNTDDKQYVGEELSPSVDALTDQQLTQFVRNHVWGHHISSSAPMGQCDSPYAVTDGGGRVYGVDALRVVDISIFPTIPHGNPAGVVMMAAEKLAEQIMKDYGVRIPTKL